MRKHTSPPIEPPQTKTPDASLRCVRCMHPHATHQIACSICDCPDFVMTSVIAVRGDAVPSKLG